MKTVYRNIYSVLKINRFIVLSVILMAFFSTVMSAWIVYKINQEALNNAFAINSDGDVIPLKWVSQKENLKVEALAHLELFHRYFYEVQLQKMKFRIGYTHIRNRNLRLLVNFPVGKKNMEY